MKKSSIVPLPEYFDRYINLVSDDDLLAAFGKSLEQLNALDRELLASLDGKRYAAGKWTVKDIFQHVIDTERIFAYRALRFARNDSTALAGFDENLYAQHAEADSRSIGDLIGELSTVRASTKALFAHFNDEALLRKGKCWNYEVSVAACGFTILGHQIHHLNVIEKLYYPLAA